MAAADPKLAAALKLAKAATKDAPLLFAMVLKGTNDGVLIVSKMKISPQDIAHAKSKCGGTTVLSGRCFNEEGKLVFEMGKAPPPAMAKVLKEIITRDAEMTSTPLPRLAQDMVEQAPATPIGSPPTSQGGALPSVQPQTQEPSAALAAWQAARVQAVNAIRKVATVVAKTKDEESGKIALMLEGIVRRLVPNPASADQVADLERYLREDGIVAAAEQVPTAIGTLRIREPLLGALQQLKTR